jgi:hypothetical protein
MRRLTRDHSLREEAVRLGKLTAEQAKNSPYAHALTRAVGSGPRPTPDLFPEPTGWFELPAGGVLLMCSDGMSGALDDGQIGELIGGAPDAPAVVQRLLRAAYHGGSNDNISVLALADQGFRATKPLPPPPPIEASPADDPTLARVSAADLSVSPPSFSRMLTKALLLGLGLVLAFLLFVFFRPLPRPGRAPAPPPVPANDGAPAAAPADGGLTVELTPGPGEL